MLPEVCPSLNNYYIPLIDISNDAMVRIKAWQRIEQSGLTPITQEILCCSTPPMHGAPKDWVQLKTTNSSCFIKLNEIRKIFQHLPVTDPKSNLQLDISKIGKSLELRLCDPNLDHLEELLPRSLKPKWPEICIALKETYQKIGTLPASMQKEGLSSHYKRSVSRTPLPVEIDSSGRSYAITKINVNSTPFESGLVKKLYFALNMHTLIPAAWAKIPLNKHPELTPQQIRKDTFEEMRIQRSFDAPQFVKIYHYCTYFSKKNEEKIGLMMELCDTSLEQYLETIYLQRTKPSKQEEMWNIFEDICLALTLLESRQIHHRDIKPANIFLVKTEKGYRAKLGDFGFATDIIEEGKDPRACGSPEYVAPEFHKAHKDIISAREAIKKCDKKIEDVRVKKEKATDYFNKAIQLIHQSEQPVYASISDEVQKKISKGEKLEKEFYNDLILAQQEKEAANKNLLELSQKAANIKGDMWGLGLILAQLRLGKFPSDLLFDVDTTFWTNTKFMDELCNLSQWNLDYTFSSRKSHRELETLNRRLLTLDPNLRISASECLQQVKLLRNRKVRFV